MQDLDALRKEPLVFLVSPQPSHRLRGLLAAARYRGFLNLGLPFLGIPTGRIIVFWGTCLVPPKVWFLLA